MIRRLEALVAERCSRILPNSPDLLARDLPAGSGLPGITSANRSCRLLRAADAWCALNLARPDDFDVLPALISSSSRSWRSVASSVAEMPAREFCERAVELQLPAAKVAEAKPIELATGSGRSRPGRVVDMSALWAGPLCAALLARSGAQVLRIESIGRPDPTAWTSPRLDHFLNAEKEKLALDLRLNEGRLALWKILDQSDVVVTSARAAALTRLGLEPDRFPNLTWVAITGHGFSGAGAERVGFGDDCAAAGGLVAFKADGPRFVGDALADPLTGLEAALAVLSGRQGLIDIPMAGVAASYASLLR